MIATIVIPVSLQHYETGIYQEAEASARAQTVPVEVRVQIDEHRHGAAWARNTAMQTVTTPFVVFLDADDVLHPAFIETTIKSYRPGSYVYTNYLLNGQLVETVPTLDMLTVGQQHITSVLLPTAAWQAAGGFDETLDTLEDEDFFRRLHAYGWCGVKCPGAALVEYRRTYGYSRVNKDSTDWDVVQRRVAEKTALFEKRYAKFMGCGKCGGNQPSQPKIAANEPGPNDVLAKALYSPMVKVGPISGKKYPRAGLGQPLWVDADDAEARPQWWQRVAVSPVAVSPDVETVKRIVAETLTNQPPPETQKTKKPPKKNKVQADAHPA